MSKRRNQHQKTRPTIEVELNRPRRLEYLLEKPHLRTYLWFPTNEFDWMLLVKLHPEIAAGKSAQEIGIVEERRWHPANSNRYFSDWDEAMSLVQRLRPYMEVELRTIKASGQADIYRVSGKHYRKQKSQHLSMKSYRRCQ